MPTHRGVPLEQTNKCLHAAMNFLERKGYTVMFHDPSSPSISANRNDGVRVAKEANADWLFFIDDDMVFDEDHIYQVLSHKLDVVGGLCVRKKWPYDPAVGVKADGEPGVFKQVCEFPDARLFECDAIGTAFLAIKMTVFDKMAEPYFAMPPTRMVLSEPLLLGACRLANEFLSKDEPDIVKLRELIREVLAEERKTHEVTSVSGEDVYWCRNAQAAGFKLLCDTSVMIGHLGHYPFTYMDTLRAKAQVEANGGKDERFSETESGEGEKA